VLVEPWLLANAKAAPPVKVSPSKSAEPVKAFKLRKKPLYVNLRIDFIIMFKTLHRGRMRKAAFIKHSQSS